MFESKRCHKFYSFTNFPFRFLTKLPEKASAAAIFVSYTNTFFLFFVFALWGSSCVQTLPIIDTLFRRCYNIPKIPEDPEPKIGEKETLL